MQQALVTMLCFVHIYFTIDAPFSFFLDLADKGNFIMDSGLAGFSMWHIVGDSNDILVDAMSNAMGIAQVCS